MSSPPTLQDQFGVVPIADDKEVEIEPGDPWPSTFRGSRYSIVDSRRHGKVVLQWKYRDLVVVVDPPEGLIQRLRDLGKSEGSGKGSIRVTAGGELVTKIHSSEYVNAHKAPVDNGWIPVYLGTIEGESFGFDIELDPDTSQDVPAIWEGFPFNHGEQWTVSHDNRLLWKWQDYRFYSAFEHPELIEAYEQFRQLAGRLYINEFGHVFVNAPLEEVPETRRERLLEMFNEWQQDVKQRGDTAAQRLVNRRLKVTGGGDPEEGHLPLHIGHLSQFDDGLIPRPVVTDESYYVAAARAEEVSGT
jgi:hypothetical protein